MPKMLSNQIINDLLMEEKKQGLNMKKSLKEFIDYSQTMLMMYMKIQKIQHGKDDAYEDLEN